MDSWRQNEVGGGLESLFWVLIGPAHKTRQRLNWQFTDYLKKRDFFTNDSKHRHIIYYWKLFFTTSMDSRSLPQNKVSFRSDQLSKFCQFVQKSVPMIWAFSIQTEYTITTRRLRGIDLHPGWLSKGAVDWWSSSTTIAAITRFLHPKRRCFTANEASCNYFGIF